MAKDGTNRGGRRVRAGAKPDPLNEKLAKGLPATRLEDQLASSFDFEGADVGAGAVLADEVMPEPSEYLSDIQPDPNSYADSYPQGNIAHNEPKERAQRYGYTRYQKPGQNVTACNPLFKRKVAAYAQVSTNLEEQATSLSS